MCPEAETAGSSDATTSLARPPGRWDRQDSSPTIPMGPDEIDGRSIPWVPWQRPIERVYWQLIRRDQITPPNDAPPGEIRVKVAPDGVQSEIGDDTEPSPGSSVIESERRTPRACRRRCRVC